MSTILDPGPPGNGETVSPLIYLINGERIEFDPATLRDNQYREQCAQYMSLPSAFVIQSLLRWSDADRWTILSFITSIPHARVRATESDPDSPDLFEATLALMVDNADIEQCSRGRQAAIEAAVLVHPVNLELAASRISGRLHDLDVRGRHANVTAIGADVRRFADSLRRAANPDQAQRLCVRDALPDLPLPGVVDSAGEELDEGHAGHFAPLLELVVPTGWHLDAAGITRLDDNGTHVMPVPVVITRRLLEVDGNSESVEITWPRDDQWKTAVVNRQTIAAPRTIVELASVGLPVTSNNAADLIQYLHDFEAQNIETLRVGRVTRRLGWVGPGGIHGFLWGRTLIHDRSDAGHTSEEIVFAGADQGEEQIADGFLEAGTLDGWRIAVAPVCRYSRARLGLYAALAPPLLEILSAANFAVSYDGPTSLGKTTELRLCASVWGCTDERSAESVLHSWDATRVGMEGAAAVQSSLPLLADDTKRARQKDVVSQLIYDLTAGRERERGSPTGLRPSRAWRTVLISTGEVPITSFFEDTGGTRGRILPVWGSPFGQADAATGQVVNALNVELLEHFGHAGPLFVQFLIDHRDDWPSWKDHYRQLCDRLRQRAGDDPVARRLAEHLAVIRITAILSHRARLFPWRYRDVTAELWNELTAEAPAADRARAALEYLASWAHSHKAEFYSGMYASSTPTCGWAGRWDVGRVHDDSWEWLGFFEPKLRAILTEGGFDPEATIRTFADRDWLRVDRDGRRKLRTTVAGTSTRLTAIERVAIDQVMGLPAASSTSAEVVRGTAPPTTENVRRPVNLPDGQANQGVSRQLFPGRENGNQVGSQPGRC